MASIRVRPRLKRETMPEAKQSGSGQIAFAQTTLRLDDQIDREVDAQGKTTTRFVVDAPPPAVPETMLPGWRLAAKQLALAYEALAIRALAGSGARDRLPGRIP